MTYREWVEDTAAELGSDGCTGVSALYRFCCLEHDIHWRTGKRRDGREISEGESNEQFRSCIQRHSPFGWWSPLAWIRWLGVTFGGLHPTRRYAPYDISAEAARRRIIAEVEEERG